jgi:hypothetical protein
MKNSLLFALFFSLFCGFLQAQITSVGLIGSAAPFGWDADTNMVQDMDSSHLWTLSVTLTDGAVKFRADDGWDVNWGAADFPFGTGTQDGPDIPVFAGDYNIEFNSNTGAYYLEIVSPIGIIGAGAPFGWDRDVNMAPDTAGTPNPNLFFVTLDLTNDNVKFRQDDDWVVNWGGSDWPTGIGTQDGPDIAVPKGGNYYITLDTSSGEYNFVENVSFTTVGIIGDATAGGWDTPTEMIQDAGDGNVWKLSTSLGDGGLQFSGNNGEIVWGSSDFPTGTAEIGGDTIPIPAGRWQIELNTKSGAFSFVEIAIYETVGIVGDATPLVSWDIDVDMVRSTTDSSQWTLQIEMSDGEAKFRANDNWDVNWGGSDFPSGTATQGAFVNIPITAGEYLVSFNSLSGAYNFKELILYDTIGIVGTATPNSSWDLDHYMDNDPGDPNLWSIASFTVTDHNGMGDGGLKFRANSGWDNNWGAADWPTGTGTQDGDNIVTVAGTYGVTFNSATGEYAFGDPLTSTKDLLKPSQIAAYPNPASEVLNIDFAEVQVSGTLTFSVYDLRGQLLVTQQHPAAQTVKMDISLLPIGSYTLQIRGEGMMVGKRFTVIEK